jgi:hypothetical protein
VIWESSTGELEETAMIVDQDLCINEQFLKTSPDREWYIRKYFPALLETMKDGALPGPHRYTFLPQRRSALEEIRFFEQQIKRLTDELDAEVKAQPILGATKS